MWLYVEHSGEGVLHCPCNEEDRFMAGGQREALLVAFECC